MQTGCFESAMYKLYHEMELQKFPTFWVTFFTQVENRNCCCNCYFVLHVAIAIIHNTIWLVCVYVCGGRREGRGCPRQNGPVFEYFTLY